MSLPDFKPVPVSELNRFEWLVLEALWGTAKSPYETQWQRWQNQVAIDEPTSTTGLVIEGNLSRARVMLKNAEPFLEGGEPDKQFLSLAAEHLGKMAGGLVGIATHFRTDPAKWSEPLAAQISDHIEATANTFAIVQAGSRTSLDSNDYYELLSPVLHGVQSDEHETSFASAQANTTLHVAALAVRTWSTFLDTHTDLEIVPGATPRSSGAYIENLRVEFENHIPTIRSMITTNHAS